MDLQRKGLDDLGRSRVKDLSEKRINQDSEIIEFELQGLICKIIPENDQDDGYSSHEFPHKHPRKQQDADMEIVGGFTLENRRYLVFCRQKPAQEKEKIPCTAIVDVLTQRELQIAMLVAEGRVTKQIAYQLKISEWTITSHLRRIYAKLGVHNRAAMVASILKESG